jgi:hypothetical protein
MEDFLGIKRIESLMIQSEMSLYGGKSRPVVVKLVAKRAIL